jgi:hypothetical protein
MMEWLAIAVDASLLVLTLIFYLLTLFRRHYRRLGAESFLYRVGESAENFYYRFIELFHRKETFFLGLSGLLVLHLITDIGNFIIPHVFGIHDELYFGVLGEAGHSPLLDLMRMNFRFASGFFQKIAIFWIYALNTIAMLLLLFLPAFIWYELYKKRGFKVGHIILSIFYTSLFVWALAPAFKILPIHNDIVLGSGLIGVDIITNQIPGLNPVFLMLMSIAVFALVFLLSYLRLLKRTLLLTAILIINFFVGYYVFFFIKTMAVWFAHPMGFAVSQIKQNNPVILLLMGLFFVITLVFYAVSFITYLIESKKEFMNIT